MTNTRADLTPERVEALIQRVKIDLSDPNDGADDMLEVSGDRLRAAITELRAEVERWQWEHEKAARNHMEAEATLEQRDAARLAIYLDGEMVAANVRVQDTPDLIGYSVCALTAPEATGGET